MRVSGKDALIRLIARAGTVFDLSGAAADGRGRANDFSMEIAGTVAEVEAYGNAFVEPLPVRQSRVSGACQAFYNAATAETNAYLWAMYQAQHAPGACASVTGYTLEVYPEGECVGKTFWRFVRTVISNFNVAAPVADVMYVNFDWQGGGATRQRVLATTFPIASVVDAFTRANEGPPMTGWLAGEIYLTGGLAVISNACGTVTPFAGDAYYAALAATVDAEAYATVSVAPSVSGDMVAVIARFLEGNGYALYYTPSNKLRLARLDDGVMTDIATSTTTVSNGDKLGIRVIGPTIYGYRMPSGGSWALALQATDTHHDYPGRVGLLAADGSGAAVVRLDDFGAAEVGSA